MATKQNHQAKVEVKPQPKAELGPERARLVAVYGNMRHLFTNELFTKDPIEVEIDGFVAVQLAAGKLARETP